MSLNSRDKQADKKITALQFNKVSSTKQNSKTEKSYEKAKKEKKKKIYQIL